VYHYTATTRLLLTVFVDDLSLLLLIGYKEYDLMGFIKKLQNLNNTNINLVLFSQSIDSLNKLFMKKVDDICKKAGVDDSHGLHHALIVLCNAEKALNVSRGFTEKQKILVRLASLLHDIDDHKYFGNSSSEPISDMPSESSEDDITEFPALKNAKIVLRECGDIYELTPTDKRNILRMIDLVSASKYGDIIPEDCTDNLWMLYPRYADRLEAIGLIGLERTFEYTVHKKSPLFLGETARASTLEELHEIASPDRMAEYIRSGGKSKTMMDHFYDKLLHLGNFPVENEYFKRMCDERIEPLKDFALLFAKKYPDGELQTSDTDTRDFKDFEKLLREFINERKTSVNTDCEKQATEFLSRF